MFFYYGSNVRYYGVVVDVKVLPNGDAELITLDGRLVSTVWGHNQLVAMLRLGYLVKA